MSDAIPPLVTIVIPVFNGSNYLSDAIDSALGQTYSSVEIVVVNDGSTDETESILESYGSQIRYISKPNGGTASALNLGIHHSRGQYVSWLSHDDKYHPNKIREQVLRIGTGTDPEVLVYTGYQIIDRKGKYQYSVKPHEQIPRELLENSLLPLMRGLIHGCSLLVPRSAFDHVGFFDESLKTTHDYDLWFRFIRKYPLLYVDKPLVMSRQHSRQSTRTVSTVNAEAEALWTKLVEKVDRVESEQMGLGSSFEFFQQTSRFLERFGYSESAARAKKLAERTVDDILVTVVIPFCNRIDWVLEAIQSVLLQSHQNLEVILVNDGSEESLDPIKDAIKGDSRILLLHQENMGPGSARNLGLEHAGGQYIAFLDSDDLFTSEKIRKQLEFMEESNFDISHTSYTYVDEALKPIEGIRPKKFSFDVFPRIISGCPIATPTVMVRRNYLGDHRFPGHPRVGEDICLWIQLTRNSPLGLLDEELSLVRRSRSTASLDLLAQIRGRLAVASFVMADPELAGNQKEVKKLLADTQLLLSSRNVARNSPSHRKNETEMPSVGVLFLRSLLHEGLLPTLRRAWRYLATRL